MNTTPPDSHSSLPLDDDVEHLDLPEEPQYETVSGMTVEISDIEVDVIDSGGNELVSSQADPEAYGIEPDEHSAPVVPSNPPAS